MVIAATAAGLFFGAQIYYSALAFQRPVGWPQAMYWSFGDWYEWALLSPVIFWMCRRFRFEGTAWRLSAPMFVVGAVVLALGHVVLCTVAAELLCAVTGGATDFWAYARQLAVNRLPFNLAVFFMIVCAWHAWNFASRYRARDAQLAEVQRQLADAQLSALRMQLNPHFLFNTLNTISSLMLTDVRAANQMLSRLGALLREVLQTDQGQEVTLGRELELATRYLDIERVRFGEKLAVSLDAPAEVRSAAVPTFILQPLIENAIRHALERRTDGGRISLGFARSEDSLFLRVSDNGAPGANGADRRGAVARRESIGLGNTRQRLEKLYARHQWLRLQDNADGGTTVEIMLPFRPLPARTS